MATRKVSLKVQIELIIEYDETTTLSEALDQIEVVSNTTPDDVAVIDFTIGDYEVEDSR